MKSAVFLDRDGVICEYVPELYHRDQFKLREGSAEAIKLLNQNGFLVFVATNQPNIAKAKMTVEELEAVHQKMELLLKAEGAFIDRVYYCPHRVGGTIAQYAIECECRKPAPGMLLQAFNDFGLDAKNCIMVGDTWRDVGCAESAGIPCLGLTGGGGFPYDEGTDEASFKPLHLFSDLLSACRWIISSTKGH